MQEPRAKTLLFDKITVLIGLRGSPIVDLTIFYELLVLFSSEKFSISIIGMSPKINVALHVLFEIIIF
jgi:hypothetical protein